MSVVPLTEAQLRAQVRTVCEKVPEARVIGIHVPGPYTGRASIRVNGEEFAVVFCPSSLALREHLGGRAPDAPGLVVLTDRDENDLGADLVARLARRRLYRIEPWRAVLDLFRARELDPRLPRGRWLAEALLEGAPADGYPAVASGVLDEDTVWDTLLRGRLGFPSADPDPRALLSWTLQPDGLAALEAAPAELRAALGERLGAAGGEAATAILRCVLAGRGRDALPIGLVGRVVFGEGAEAEPRLWEAAVRLEPAFGGQAPARAPALAWADAAEAVVRDLLAAGAGGTAWTDRAEAILREVRAEEFAYRSSVLVSGFDQRLARCAGVLAQVVAGTATPDSLAPVAVSALAHDQARAQPARAEALRMACRLARRVRPAGAEPGSFVEAACRYAADGSFADWARTRVWEGDPLPSVAEAYRALAERLHDEREEENRRFATFLAGWVAHGSPSDAIVPVEEALARVVLPLAQETRVLVLVIDGLSLAVFHELLADLARHGWVELGHGDAPARRPAIAALPSVTEVSRTSLLCGALRRGGSQAEREGFSSHPGLVAASRSGFPPLLFHKADLVEPGGVGLASGVRDEIAGPARHVVGAVINAVDDSLAKSEQLRLLWTVDAIRPLRGLLEAARDAGRVIVLASDHGHVLDRDSLLRQHETDSLRCRPDDGAPAGDEVVLHGPRVLSPWGDRLIAPWSERIRYGIKQSGYHGGATPQEIVVPLAVLAAAGQRLPAGWSEIAASVPEWWDVTEVPRLAEATGSAPAPVVLHPPTPVKAQEELFAPPAATPSPAPAAPPPASIALRPAPPWIDRLLVSATYAAQKQRATRPALDDERVRRCLLALDERGGTMTQAALARALSMPPLRLPGFLAALRRLLNVEGYGVLVVGDDTVELNRPLLETQFELGA